VSLEEAAVMPSSASEWQLAALLRMGGDAGDGRGGKGEEGREGSLGERRNDFVRCAIFKHAQKLADGHYAPTNESSLQPLDHSRRLAGRESGASGSKGDVDGVCG